MVWSGNEEVVMHETIAESLGAEHKERIYRTMEHDVKLLKDLWLKTIFDSIVEWRWDGDVYCLFYQHGSWLSLFPGAEKRFGSFLSAFSEKYNIPIEIRKLEFARYGTYSPYRQ
jgi:hypothetical protein